MIRVYAFSLQPYGLPNFLTLRVFALELVRKILTVEDEHFLSYKKPSRIIFPWTVGPLTIKSKSSLPTIEIMLREMGFSMEYSVNYDLHHIISDRRQENKNKTFEHFEVAGLSEA